MNHLIFKNKLIRFAATTALLSIVLYFGFLYVVLKEKREVEGAYQNTESQSAKEEKARSIQSFLESNKEPIQTLGSFFIKKGDEVQFIEQIETEGRQAGVKFEIASIDINQEGGDSFKEDVRVAMKIEGSWGAVLRFAEALEEMPFGVVVESANLDATKPGVWSGSVKFLVFREK